jgi:hypothetical protein
VVSKPPWTLAEDGIDGGAVAGEDEGGTKELTGSAEDATLKPIDGVGGRTIETEKGPEYLIPTRRRYLRLTVAARNTGPRQIST